MGMIDRLKSIFQGVPDINLRKNPDITLYLGNDDDYFLFNNNPEDISNPQGRKTLVYKCYPRDIDQNKDETEQLKELTKEHKLIIPWGYAKTVGKGNGSKFRTINLLFPYNPKDLKDGFKEIFEIYMHQLKAKLDVDDLIETIDVNKAIRIKNRISVFHSVVDKIIDQSVEDLKLYAESKQGQQAQEQQL